MTEAVKAVSSNPWENKRLIETDETTARGLDEKKKNRKKFIKEKAAELRKNNKNLSEKEAKRIAENLMKNTRTAVKVDDTSVFIDRNSYEQAIVNNKDINARFSYIDDEDIRNAIINSKNELRKSFYTADDKGELTIFNSQGYKNFVGQFTGGDNRLNLDERHALSKALDITYNGAKKMAKYANYEYEKDDTALMKTGTALLGLAASVGAGYLLRARFNSYVDGVHQNGIEETLDVVTTKEPVGKSLLRGLGAGVLPTALAVMLVKDNGQKDIFNGLSADAMVAYGKENLESCVDGKANQKMMRQILDMKNLSNEQKAILLEYAYGNLTGKKVNERELTAAYQVAQILNENPPKQEEQQKDPTITGTTPPDPNAGKNVENKDPEETNTDPKTPVKTEQAEENKNDETCQILIKDKELQYTTVKFDDPYNVTVGRYRRVDGKPMTHKETLALRYKLFGKGNGFKVNQKITFEPFEECNGIKYEYYEGDIKRIIPKSGKFGNGKMNYFKDPGKLAHYLADGCSEKAITDDKGKTQLFNTKAEAAEVAKEIAKTNSKYFFIEQ